MNSWTECPISINEFHQVENYFTQNFLHRDWDELVAAHEAISEELGKPSALIADAGYSNAEAFEQLEEQGCEVYVSVSSENDHNRRGYEFRPPDKLINLAINQ